MSPRTLFGLVLGLPLLGCGPPDGAVLVPAAAAGCEAPTDALSQTNENMFPGRVCTVCHTAGGQATNSPFTVSGTVFSTLNAPCNPGGALKDKNVYVEIFNADGTLQENGRIRVNAIGNFRSSSRYVPPFKVRVASYDVPWETALVNMVTPKELRSQPMLNALGRTDTGSVKVSCNECHQLPGQALSGLPMAPGRVYLTQP